MPELSAPPVVVPGVQQLQAMIATKPFIIAVYVALIMSAWIWSEMMRAAKTAKGKAMCAALNNMSVFGSAVMFALYALA
jgi:hypothetical protein